MDQTARLTLLRTLGLMGWSVRCGRIVMDNAIDKDVLEEAYDFKDRLHAWEGLEIVQRLLERHFKTGPLKPVGGTTHPLRMMRHGW